MDEELCICGSGRIFARCHGLRGRERRHRGRELQGLGELHDLAFLFPFVRPRGTAFAAFADRVAAVIGEDLRDTTPAEAAEGVRLLSGGERRRLVRSWAGRYPERWRRVCASVGDTALAEATLVASAVRGAVADRLQCPREVIAELEDGGLERSPGAALALVIKPDTVWSYEEALEGRGVVTSEHVERVRTQTRRLERRLPLEGLPRASATLIRGCELVADGELVCDIAELLLESYEIQMEWRASSIRSRN